MRRAGVAIRAQALAALALLAPAAPAAGLADHVDVFAGTRPGPRHLRRRPQLPRRDGPLRHGPVEP